MTKADMRGRGLPFVFLAGILLVAIFLANTFFDLKDRYEISEFYLKGIAKTETENALITTTNDPILELKEGRWTYIDNVAIELARPVGREWKFQVFYTSDADEAFNKNKSILKKVDADQQTANIVIRDQVYKFRIDLGDEEGVYFYISNIEVSHRDQRIFLAAAGTVFTSFAIYVLFCLFGYLCYPSQKLDRKKNVTYLSFSFLAALVICAIFTDAYPLLTPYSISLASLVFLIFLCLCFSSINRNDGNPIRKDNRFTGAYALVLIVLPSILLWKYLSGSRLFIFMDIASDSFAQYYPSLVFTSDRIHKGILSSGFSFQKGLGDSFSSFFPALSNWPALFREDHIAYFMGFSFCLKMILSGLLAYKWASLFGLDPHSRLLIATGYQFNAMLTVRSGWADYPNLALMVILWLACFELVLRKGRGRDHLFFAIATEVFFLQLQLYYCILYSAVFLVYIIIRVHLEKRGSAFILKTTLLYYIPFAAFGMGDKVRQSFVSVLSSNRVASGIGSLKNSAEGLWAFKWGNLFDAFIRSIGIGIEGVYSDFVGIDNYLEGPAFYSGILLFLLIPASLYNLSKRKRRVYLFALLISLLVIGVDGIRLIIAGFSGTSYKYTTFWIVIAWFLIVAEALREVKSAGIRQGSLRVFNITALCVLFLLFMVPIAHRASRIDQWWISFFFCCAYVVFINLWIGFDIASVKMLLFFLLLSEGFLLSYSPMNDRDTLTKKQLDSIYYDEMYESIQSINLSDEGWHRIEKGHVSGFLCDSYVQRFFGTASYVGGIGINKHILDYYSTMGLPGDSRYLKGTCGNLYANALLGVKYIFTNSPYNRRYGTRLIDQKGSIYIYENDLALPIAYVYQDTISKEELNKYAVSDRNRILLQDCVTAGSNGYRGFDKVEDIRKEHAPDLVVEAKDAGLFGLQNTEGKLILLFLHYDNDAAFKRIGGMQWMYSDGSYSDMEFTQSQVIELHAEKEIACILMSVDSMVDLEHIDVYVVDPDLYYDKTVKSIAALSKRGMKDAVLSGNKIEGTLSTDVSGILATSIPYDEKWQIYVDDVKMDTFIVNTGFLGCRISAGSHDISIIYRANTWLKDNLFKLIGLLLWIVLLIRFTIGFKKTIINILKKSPGNIFRKVCHAF